MRGETAIRGCAQAQAVAAAGDSCRSGSEAPARYVVLLIAKKFVGFGKKIGAHNGWLQCKNVGGGVLMKYPIFRFSKISCGLFLWY